MSRQKTCPFISRKVGVWVLALMLCAVIQFGVVRDVKASMGFVGAPLPAEASFLIFPKDIFVFHPSITKQFCRAVSLCNAFPFFTSNSYRGRDWFSCFSSFYNKATRRNNFRSLTNVVFSRIGFSNNRTRVQSSYDGRCFSYVQYPNQYVKLLGFLIRKRGWSLCESFYADKNTSPLRLRQMIGSLKSSIGSAFGGHPKEDVKDCKYSSDEGNEPSDIYTPLLIRRFCLALISFVIGLFLAFWGGCLDNKRKFFRTTLLVMGIFITVSGVFLLTVAVFPWSWSWPL